MSFPPRPGMVPGMPVTHVMHGGPFVPMSVQAIPGMMPNVGMHAMPPSGPMMQHSMGYARPGLGMRQPMMGHSHSPATVSAPPQIRSNLASRHGRAMHMSSSQGKQLQGGNMPATFDDSSGPTVTVFVGNITERAPDILIRQMLNSCGPVLAWKRVQGASGKLQAFGFCEFTNPDSGLRAIRLLHDFPLADKKLVVKVDAKTKDVLYKFKGDKKKELRGETGSSDAPAEAEDVPDADYMSDDMRRQDSAVKEKLAQLLLEFKAPMENYTPNTPREPRSNKRVVEVEPQDDGRGAYDPPASDLNIAEDQMLDEEQKELISREIGKFRETMKKEEAKEKEKTRPDTRKKPDAVKSGDTSKEVKPKKEKSPTPSIQEPVDKGGFGGSTWAARKRSKSRSKTRSKSRSPGGRTRTRRLEGSSRDRRDDRRGPSRDRDSRRNRDRERGREREERREDGDREKQREMEEEQGEREKEERRMQEKEQQYQNRLRKWEAREKSKTNEHKREKDKERSKKVEMEKEAVRLLQFLQDYDDERDDDKYYKARELQRRMNERKIEDDLDKKDRQKEKEELEELCARIMAEGHGNPEAEFQRIKAQRDAKCKPMILVPIPSKDAEGKDGELEKEREKKKNKKEKPRLRKASGAGEDGKKNGVTNGDAATELITPRSPEAVKTPPFVSIVGRGTSNVISDARHGSPRSPIVLSSGTPKVTSRTPTYPPGPRTPGEPSVPAPAKDKQPLMTVTGRKRVVEVQQAFADDDDEEDGEFGRRKRSRRPQKQEGPVAAAGLASAAQTTPVADQSGKTPKTPIVPHDDTSMEAMVLESYIDDGGRSASGTPAGSSSKPKGEGDKRKQIKEIIDRIPSDKAALFNHRIEWNAVDQNMLQNRIRPWVNKKMVEYIGEEEPTLVEFICQKIMNRSTPQDIMADVQMVLDEEAEIFVIKTWRLLIYEIEAKKMGIGK